MLLRYANDTFSPTFITTIGIDFKIKTIQLDEKVIKLQVRRFRTWTEGFRRKRVAPDEGGGGEGLRGWVGGFA